MDKSFQDIVKEYEEIISSYEEIIRLYKNRIGWLWGMLTPEVQEEVKRKLGQMPF